MKFLWRRVTRTRPRHTKTHSGPSEPYSVASRQ